MSLASKLLSASGGAVDKLYVDDVFSAYTYTGNGSTQTINNGIDLAGKGGMVWIKSRGASGWHYLTDTQRPLTQSLQSNLTNAQSANGVGMSVNSSGFSFATLDSDFNFPSSLYASWTFRRSAKFFDVVTYTGTGVAGRQIPHALGVAPGMVIVKRTDAVSGGWAVWHRATTSGHYLLLNSTAASTASSAVNVFGNDVTTVNPNAANFTIATDAAVNASGGTYVAYLFAHDASADGIVQCGSFTPSANIATVNLGWEPQYVLIKVSGGVDDWYVWDTSRPFSLGSSSTLRPNTSGAEGVSGTIYPTATGFYTNGMFTNVPHIYLAIRRPNKPPTTGTQVYNAIARTGTGAAATVTGVGFAPDLAMIADRGRVASATTRLLDRLRGATQEIRSQTTGAEATDATGLTAFGSDGVMFGAGPQVNSTSQPYINHFFKRAPGVFDQVCYTGTGVAKTEAHGLGVVPELIIVKKRSAIGNWLVALNFGTTNYSYMTLENVTSANSTTYAGNYYHGAAPTSTGIALGADVLTNGSAATYVAYLFATKTGISKVGSYTGNGTSLTLDMGFTTGARFFMVKRTDAAGDWYVWDTVRGLVAGNDPHLSLNTTAAEVTTNDSVDPASVGLVVNQLATTNINVTSATYIYWAYA